LASLTLVTATPAASWCLAKCRACACSKPTNRAGSGQTVVFPRRPLVRKHGEHHLSRESPTVRRRCDVRGVVGARHPRTIEGWHVDVGVVLELACPSPTEKGAKLQQ
jgi:hypothetical protein